LGVCVSRGRWGGGGVVDKEMLYFVGGILAIAVVLIYFLFIKGD
jgi:hypothetical protein